MILFLGERCTCKTNDCFPSRPSLCSNGWRCQRKIMIDRIWIIKLFRYAMFHDRFFIWLQLHMVQKWVYIVAFRWKCITILKIVKENPHNAVKAINLILLDYTMLYWFKNRTTCLRILMITFWLQKSRNLNVLWSKPYPYNSIESRIV